MLLEAAIKQCDAPIAGNVDGIQFAVGLIYIHAPFPAGGIRSTGFLALEFVFLAPSNNNTPCSWISWNLLELFSWPVQVKISERLAVV